MCLGLELPSTLRQLDDPGALLLARSNQLLILNGVQRTPELFAVLRSVIDLGIVAARSVAWPPVYRWMACHSASLAEKDSWALAGELDGSTSVS